MEVRRIQPDDDAGLDESADVLRASDKDRWPELEGFSRRDIRGFARFEGGSRRFDMVAAREGAGPVLDECASCGAVATEEPLVAFDMLSGGALCRRCRRGRSVSAEALALVRRILGGSLGSVLAAPPPPEGAEVAALATEAMEAHLDRRLRAVHSAAGL